MSERKLQKAIDRGQARAANDRAVRRGMTGSNCPHGNMGRCPTCADERERARRTTEALNELDDATLERWSDWP